MDSLTALKKLQDQYQIKFAELIALHNKKDAKELESSEYLQIREEWIKTGDEIRTIMESLNLS